ncbi:MAG: hypothetical protein N3G20_01295, partial [Verrucomicrobiae bacterium]|nr:hypothetical protein [Verrucomicrobiae bacterium]
MTDHKVARWGSKLKTLTELHTLTDPDTNQENDTLTPSQLFANYGGNNYQQDYRLRPGVWALTAASDGTYVGAFGLMDLPTVTVVATQPDAAEGTPPTQGTFTVTRQGPTTGNLTVYFTLSGVAAPGNAPGGDYTTIPPANYLAKTGSVVIASGATSATVTVVPLDDNEVEDNETVVLTLQPGLYYSLGSPLQATVYISDNDVRNIAPIVNAGSDQSILTNSLPARTLLRGSATDPDNGPTTPLAFRWSKVSGPGTVTFGNEMQNETTAEFSQAGSYVLQLEADDGADKGSDVVEIAIVSNAAPVVDAGEDMTMTLPMNCTLHGRLIADDGLPGAPSYRWSKVSGPGTVVFAHETSLNTGVRFGQTGVYILQLEANDGMAKGLDTVTVMVRANASFTARTNGRFASADTWVGEAGVNGPPLPGDTAYIANTVVEAITEDEIPDLVTVNIESNGMLRCAAVDVRIFPVSTSATLNVAAGGVLLLGSNQTLSCAVTLSGGTIDFRGAVLEGILNVNSDSFLSVQSDLATIRAQVNGHGRLTLTGGD